MESVTRTVGPVEISIIVPCRNEAAYVATFLDSLNKQLALPDATEILIVDGRSEDGTREMLRDARARNPSIRILDNPDRSTPAGLNIAIRASRGRVLVRMDVHTDYAPDYVSESLRVLKETGADNVGGPWRARGMSYTQRAISSAFQSIFSSGGALSHRLDYEGRADSVFLGCWHREVFDRVGLFDEELIRNQDEELNFRIAESGGVIWQSPRISASYFPRATLGALFSQYAHYGYWKIRVMQKHGKVLAARHVVPALFLSSLIVLLGAASFSFEAYVGFLVILGSYLATNCVASVHAVARTRSWDCLPILPVVFACFHLGYGYGALRGFLDFVVLRKSIAWRQRTSMNSADAELRNGSGATASFEAEQHADPGP